MLRAKPEASLYSNEINAFGVSGCASPMSESKLSAMPTAGRPQNSACTLFFGRTLSQNDVGGARNDVSKRAVVMLSESEASLYCSEILRVAQNDGRHCIGINAFGE